MTRWGGPAVTGTEQDIDGREIDFDARYTVASMPGVAWWLHGWGTEIVPESRELACDGTDDDHDESCWLYSEPEEVPDRSRVRAVMVGDDAVHIVGTDELTEITEDDYCAGCGQTGCRADGRDTS
jgi:hypothetical protein